MATPEQIDAAKEWLRNVKVTATSEEEQKTLDEFIAAVIADITDEDIEVEINKNERVVPTVGDGLVQTPAGTDVSSTKEEKTQDEH